MSDAIDSKNTCKTFSTEFFDWRSSRKSRVFRLYKNWPKDIGRRLPLELQCSYQGHQVDVSQSVRGNYKTRF